MSYNELVTVVAIVAGVSILVVDGVSDRKRRRKDGSGFSGMVGTFDEAFHAGSVSLMYGRNPSANAYQRIPVMVGS